MPKRPIIAALAVLLLAAIGAALVLGLRLGRITEAQVRETVTTTIQAERPDAFLVTGTLDMTATVTKATRQVFLPGVFDVDLGTSEATLRVPGKAAYGFDVRTLRPQDVRLLDGGIVEVTLPALSVHTVEPDLSRLEVQTRRGWLRSSQSVDRMEAQATQQLTAALRRQAEAHLAGSALQARQHTADALAAMLRPALVAAGMEAPRFRFRADEGVTIEVD